MPKKVSLVKKVASKALTQIGMRSTDISCKQSCIYIAYEPKQPKALKERNRK